jgi:hypothetical protein
LFRRDYTDSPYVMETVRPIEVPVIALVKRHLSEGHFTEAITLAFQTVLVDLQRAYRFPFPAHWTHRDVLQWAARNNLGLVPELLQKLYRMYEPVRYGTPGDIRRGDVLSPLTSLYAQSPLWRLYSGPYFRSGYGGAYGGGYGGGYGEGGDLGNGEGEAPSEDMSALPPP